MVRWRPRASKYFQVQSAHWLLSEGKRILMRHVLGTAIAGIAVPGEHLIGASTSCSELLIMMQKIVS
jgi:hypothetical protein